MYVTAFSSFGISRYVNMRAIWTCLLLMTHARAYQHPSPPSSLSRRHPLPWMRRPRALKQQQKLERSKCTWADKFQQHFNNYNLLAYAWHQKLCLGVNLSITCQLQNRVDARTFCKTLRSKFDAYDVYATYDGYGRRWHMKDWLEERQTGIAHRRRKGSTFDIFCGESYFRLDDGGSSVLRCLSGWLIFVGDLSL